MWRVFGVEVIVWFFMTVVAGAVPALFRLYDALKNHHIHSLSTFWALPEGWIYAFFLAMAATQEALLEHKGQGIWRTLVLCICPIMAAIAGFAYASLVSDGEGNLDLIAHADPLAQPQLYAIIILALLSAVYIIPVKLAKARSSVGKKKK